MRYRTDPFLPRAYLAGMSLLKCRTFGRILAAVIAIHAAACATRPADIQPRYLSPLVFGQATCAQLRVEASTISSHLDRMGPRIERNANVDAVWVGTYVPLVVLLPFTFFLLNGDGPEYEEYSALLGQRHAVYEQQRQKHCTPGG